MEKISLNDTTDIENNNHCKVKEYSFNSKQIDLGIATITGRYPEKGYCCNMVSEELVYGIEGSGKLYYEDGCISFEKGDAILISPKEKYYWDSTYCVVSLSCTQAWSPDQYKIFE